MSQNNENHEVLLARIDERTRILNETLASLSSRLEKNYVTHEEFSSFKKEMRPIKNGFFAVISCIVFTVILAVIGQVIKK